MDAFILAISLIQAARQPAGSSDPRWKHHPWKRSPLEGTWVGSRRTTDLSQIRVSRSGRSWFVDVRVFGVHDDIGWPRAKLEMFGGDIESSTPTYAIAHWNTEFSFDRMILHRDGNRIVAENFTRFTDHSGRSNYRMVESLERAAVGVAHRPPRSPKATRRIKRVSRR